MADTSPKTRVAFFAEILIEDFDGATRTMFQIIKRIPREDFEYLFICGVGPSAIEGFECVTIPSFTLPINVNYKMALPGLAQSKLKETLAAFDPDVVHIATPSLLGAFAAKYAQKIGLPVITIYHTHFVSYIDYYLKHAPFLIEFVKQRVISGQKTFYNQCDKVYVPSESIAGELTGFGINNDRIRIWKRGIDSVLFSPQKRNPQLLREITGNDHPTILFASRLVWEKNLETLFEIYDLLQAGGQPHNFLVAGNGLALKACKQRMKKAVFTGKADHQLLSQLYASADIFLFPSVSETYGNVVLEAMASGLACVIADGGGSRDFITQGENGFRCPPFQAADYVEKINLLLQNESLRKQLSAEGLRYSQQYEWKKLTDIYFEDVKNLAGQTQEVLLN